MRSCVGPDERAAELGVVAAAERVVEHAAADAVARLEHDHRAAGLHDLARGGEPGEARADDDDVGGASGSTAAWLRRPAAQRSPRPPPRCRSGGAG